MIAMDTGLTKLRESALIDGVAESIEIAYYQKGDEIHYINRTDSFFDIASLTKVLTGLLVMQLDEGGILSINDKVKKYIPSFPSDAKLYNLLRHDAGLRDRDFNLENIANNQYIVHEPEIVYSDMNYILLYKIIDKIGGYETLMLKNILVPLKIEKEIVFPRNVPIRNAIRTEKRMERSIKEGIVHDNKCYQMGGISGHAGIFATIEGLAKLFVNLDKIINVPTLQKKLDFYKLDTRTIIFEIDDAKGQMSEYKHQAYFHTGFTGTSILIDEDFNRFIIIFTNRIYPTRDNDKIFSFRKEVNDFFYQRNKTERK